MTISNVIALASFIVIMGLIMFEVIGSRKRRALRLQMIDVCADCEKARLLREKFDSECG